MIDPADGKKVFRGFARVETEIRRVNADPGNLNRDSPDERSLSVVSNRQFCDAMSLAWLSVDADQTEIQR